jgi:TonB family protein
MMASATRQGFSPGEGRRSLPRYHVAAPIDIVVLRSGVPDTIPGRSIDLGEGGLGAIAASELQPGQSVAVEIFLPNATQPIRARAQVRYQQKLHCGLKFFALPRHEQEMLRYWLHHAGAPAVVSNFVEPATQPEPPLPIPERHGEFLRKPVPRSRRSRKWRSRKWIQRGAALIFLAVMFSWWKWQSGWNEIESQVKEVEVVAAPRLQVPSAVMAQRVRHKLDPVYPQAARAARVQGVVILNVVVGTDGTVKTVRALSGPEPLTQAAIDAVRWWKFEPYTVDGSPVEAESTVAVDFRPGF